MIKTKPKPMTEDEIKDLVNESLKFHLDQPRFAKDEIEIAADPFGIGIIAAQMNDGSQFVVFRNGDVKDVSFSAWPPRFNIIPRGE